MSDEPLETQEEVEATPGDEGQDSIFRFTTYVHVGQGADECEHATDGRCTIADHFHAWCRLPNVFQHEELMRKGNAAKARLIRAFKDPESDAHVILEATLDEMRDEERREELVEMLIGEDHWQVTLDNMRQIEGEEEEFSTRPEDVERTKELLARDADERSPEEEEELTELQAHNERYRELVEERVAADEEPRRTALRNLPLDGLVDEIRKMRIAEEAGTAFGNAYTRYEWYACTLKPCFSGHPQERSFKSISDLDNAAPEIVANIKMAFAELERSLQRGLTGN